MKETIQRNEPDLWERFLNSGRVEDYLNYVSCSECGGKRDTVSSHPEGDGSHAGIYTGNRYHIETDAYR